MTIDFGYDIFIVLFIILSSICILRIKEKVYKVVGVFFSFYVLCLVKIVFFPIYIPSQAQLLEFKSAMSEDFSMVQYIPLKNISLTLESTNWLMQIGGNIALLIPLVVFAGVFLDYRNKYSIIKTIIIGVGVSIVIETIQAIMNYIIQYPNRIADIDDIILNSFGVVVAAIGYGIIRKIYFRCNRREYA